MGGLVSFFERLPRTWMQWHKPISAALAILDGCAERISELRGESEDQMTPSIFHVAMHPKPEKGHPVLSSAEMAADALTMFVAGTDTTYELPVCMTR
jgi:cytochrome P450